MKKTLLYLAVLYTSIVTNSLFAEEVTFTWKGTSEMNVIHDLFLDSFLSNYKELGLTAKDLGTDNIEQVLEGYWAEELASLQDGHVTWIVAKLEDEIIGYASFDRKDAPEDVVLQLLCVSPGFQGRGIGSNLVYSITWAERGIQKLSLVTRQANTSAIAFYKYLGFVESDSINKKANIDTKLCIQLEKIF
ncbi:MAG: GNAT family N-acetyltransferase [Chlamydiae bacterium]|nr:GNAT family N-acetyltransferase [Chlamydiota bacterium]